MLNPRVAMPYAKSLIDLAVEKGRLEEVNKDIEFLAEVMRVSPEFKTVLASPVINANKKVTILGAVTDGKVGPITAGFFQLLLNKGRENVLPEIVTAFKEQYNVIKGINKVKLTTPSPVSEEQKNQLINKLTAETGLGNIVMETEVDESLIGGFILEFDHKVIDASLKFDLKQIRKSFMRNDYIYNIR
ncbi:MAG: ATP synthase F1 subunit delta [Bacteroidota bacterium]